jgi:hypothetical protein
MTRVNWLRFFLLVLLAACQSPAPSATLTPRAAAIAQVTPTPFYIGPLKSPDGKTRAQAICYQGYMMSNCEAHFPNGHVLGSIPDSDRYDWSPDNNYAFVYICQNHDSPCEGFQVWDLVNGVAKDLPHIYLFQWDTDQPHTLFYLANSGYGAPPDHFIEYDAATGAETSLPPCPAWANHNFQLGCDSLPGVVIGGRLSGLSGTVELRLIATTPDGHVWGSGSVTVNSDWTMTLRKGLGVDYIIAPDYVFVTSPLSYTVHISGSQAFVTDHGVITPLTADHLDFHLEAVR